MAEEGFFFTPKISKQNVAFSSGCVTWAFFMRSPEGRINRSYFGGLRVKLGSTKVIFVTTRFQAFFLRLPDACTRNISSSATARTLGIGTDHFPAFSARFCLMLFERIFALEVPSLSRRNAGKAALSSDVLFRARASFSSWAAIVFLKI